MKKIILSVLICTLFTPQFVNTAEASSLRMFAEQWKKWIREKAPEKKEFRINTGRRRSFPVPTTTAEKTKDRLFNTTKAPGWVRQRYIIEDSNAYLSRSELTIVMTPIEPVGSISTIDSQTYPVFKISAQNNNNLRSTQAPETLYLTRLKFQVFDNNGIASDPTRFSLVVNDQLFDIDKDGTVSVDFINERITARNSKEIDVSFRVKDPEDTPNVDGALRFRVLEAEAVREGLFDAVRTKISGKSISQYHSFRPVLSTATDQQIAGSNVIKIWGKTLVAGAEDYVLNLNFGANFDDLSLEQIVLSDSLSNGKIDSLTSKVTAVNSRTGEILGTSKFTGSRARFKFLPAIRINRGDDFEIAFKVLVAENASQSTKFKLDLLPSDVRVRSISSGSDLNSTDKYFSFNSDTFSIARSVFNVATSATQPENWAASGSALERVYRFSVTNPGDRSISLARVSMDVNIGGLAFAGSKVASRFDLREIRGDREASASAFTPTLVGDKIVFDAKSEFLISRNSTTEFALKLQLVDLAGDSKNDYVAVKILDDSTLTSGSLATVQATGANFIWSDHAASPHSISTTDWHSGYLVPGLPTNTQVNKRQ